jgi:hypothetical protein
MKGDFTRDTFDPKKHYRDVLIQQGRVQVDADWNEQAAVTARRDETTTADIVGDCGGPADDAAFGVSSIPPVGPASSLPPVNTSKVAGQSILPVILPSTAGDFLLSAGRYYVDGIQCENEQPVRFTTQPDRLGVGPLAQGSYLLYLDVWHRHLTALEDGQIREPALGGPDHGTRVKTIWQVCALDLTPPAGPGVIQGNPCGSGADLFKNLADPGTAKLTAHTATQQAPTDPCLIPPSAGYTGLENQLYRVEIHDPGSAFNAGTVAGTAVTLPSGNAPKNIIGVTGGTWAVGNVVEIYPSQTSSPKMKGQLARITAVSGSSLTLNIPVTGFVAADAPKLRKISGATCKWSRENGSVVTRVEKISLNKITVSSLGPDKNLGFVKDAWVEILDDALELEGKPGQLAQIDDVDEATRIITLKSAASSLVPAGFSTSTYPNGVVPQRHPKLRRWEGLAAVKFVTDANTNWLPLESGIEVRFANGSYRTGHFWQIPARAATAQATAGDIEWPGDNANRLALAPRGITHHFCRLGIVTVKADGSIDSTDCRCLWPALTAVPRLFYVSGDGQEVMPDLTNTTGLRYPLPQPLIVGLGNGQCAPEGTKVRFAVILGDGRVTTGGPLASTVDVPIGADGMAQCNFHLDGNYPAHYSQRARAQLLNAAGALCSLPIIFNATLSVAGEVAYNPDGCGALQGKKTVQDAIARLASLARLEAVGGDGQDAEPGAVLAKPIQVLVTSACGPVAGAKVRFDTGGNQGLVTDIGGGSPGPILDVTTVADGLATCRWKPSADPLLATQELTATLILPNNTVLKQPGTLRFTANLRLGKGCCVTVGEGGDFVTLATAITTLIERDHEEICICLLPGDHEVSQLFISGAAANANLVTGGTAPDDLSLNLGTGAGALRTAVATPPPNNALRHLHIHGCGRASRILLQNWFYVQNLTSIALQDLCIYADAPYNPAGPPLHVIVIDQCRDVTITGCHLRQTSARNDWVIIRAPAPPDSPTAPPIPRTNIADNIIESSATVPWNWIGNTLVEDAGVAAMKSAPINVRAIAETAAATLAGKKKVERAAFLKEFRQIVKDVPPGDPNKKSLAAALKHLSAKSSLKQKSARATVDASMMASIETPQGLAESVTGAVPNWITVLVPALVIVNAYTDTSIVNNIIRGAVRIYGFGGAFSQTVFYDLALGIKNHTFILGAPSTRSLRIEGNSLTNVLIDSQIVQPPPPGGKGAPTLIGLFARMSLLDNTFHEAGNQWLAAHVISNGNYFVVTDSGLTIGVAAGASFICMGTSANWFPVTLRFGVPLVATNQPPRFALGANLMTVTQVT